MTKLECWLPQKEMFGRFTLNSVSAESSSLKIIVSNEVFQFTINFSTGVSAYSVTEPSRNTKRLEAFKADYEVLMRGNTFFKLSNSSYLKEYGTENDIHYFIAATNAVVDVLSSTSSSITLEQAKKS